MIKQKWVYLTQKRKNLIEKRKSIILLVAFFTGCLVIGINAKYTENLISQPFYQVKAQTPQKSPNLQPELTVESGYLYSNGLENVPAKTIQAWVTAYSEIDSCHTGSSCLMASGNKAYIGAIACPRNIKLFTRVSVDGKIYTCEDHTALFIDGRFDIFIGYGQESYDKAIEFGKQPKRIEIID